MVPFIDMDQWLWWRERRRRERSSLLARHLSGLYWANTPLSVTGWTKHTIFSFNNTITVDWSVACWTEDRLWLQQTSVMCETKYRTSAYEAYQTFSVQTPQDNGLVCPLTDWVMTREPHVAGHTLNMRTRATLCGKAITLAGSKRLWWGVLEKSRNGFQTAVHEVVPSSWTALHCSDVSFNSGVIVRLLLTDKHTLSPDAAHTLGSSMNRRSQTAPASSSLTAAQSDAD